MKRFLLRLGLCLAVLAALVASYVLFYVETHAKLPFFANSVCFNAKAKFIAEHRQLLQESKIVIIGSSMNLYTIDGCQIRDSFHVPVINLASWGLKFTDFEKFDIWHNDKDIFINLHFTDFGPSPIYRYSGFPYKADAATNYLNIFLNFATYCNHVDQYAEYTRKDSVNEYMSLKFDSTGSVIIPEKPIPIDSPRWNSSTNIFTDEQMEDLVKAIAYRAKMVHQMVISFSPPRPGHYEAAKSVAVKKFGARLRTIPNVLFINYFDIPVTYGDFIDDCHLSGGGARRYTRLLIDSLKHCITFHIPE